MERGKGCSEAEGAGSAVQRMQRGRESRGCGWVGVGCARVCVFGWLRGVAEPGSAAACGGAEAHCARSAAVNPCSRESRLAW